MTVSSPEPPHDAAATHKHIYVRVRRKRRARFKDHVLVWYRARRRRLRLWLLVAAMVVAGFVAFLGVRTYLDGAASIADQGGEAPQ
jgi:Tfp pilus assembly protein PilN